MMFVLENDDLKLTCTEKGGQMRSLIRKSDGRELLYQGDQAWKDQNPSLFPIIGSTWSGSYEMDGKSYSMKNHGLARYAMLEGTREADCLIFSFSDDETTRSQYPFGFGFVMEYRLEGPEVKITYRIENTGDRPMPFTLGLHPAFRTDPFEDCELVFEPAGKAVQFHTFEDGRPVEYETVELDRLSLDRGLIRKERTLIWKDYDTEQVTLLQNGRAQITMKFPGFPFLAVWTHPQDSEFVCIEPWYGHADLEKLDVPFEKREGTMILEPGRTWTTSYAIEVK
ncbi:aldose 1-epimerase family protein [uncultured Faecalibaculum sp.]|uniref:aldose epimerase family protein n=1 Tax=uncultured Faecalibaculum sp. TaxID=1729681 RepID=UPI0025EE5F3D|nr:aldose 1-epimerase family protein [uncultured Faecalibaculum sp.]